MQRTTLRYTVELLVEIAHGGSYFGGFAIDLSRTGMFVPGVELEPGTAIEVAIAPEGKRLAIPATVTHRLDTAQARTRGRVPGIGIRFSPPVLPGEHLFSVAIERMLRVQHQRTTPAPRTLLSGKLAVFGVPAVLALLEVERKTGRITLDDATWIDVIAGCIVGAGSPLGEAPHDALARALDARAGSFALTGTATRGELELPITHALLEHARITDERSGTYRAAA